jgi:hypothetical protein
MDFLERRTGLLDRRAVVALALVLVISRRAQTRDAPG